MEQWRFELYYDELYHHGIKGQQWGRRRYQNEDGSLTEEGRRRYGTVGKDANIKLRDIRKEFKYTMNTAKAQAAKNYRNKMNKILTLNNDSATSNASIKEAKKEYAAKVKEAGMKAYSDFEKKYGTKRMNELRTIDNLKKSTLVTAAIAGTLALPIGGFIGGGLAAAEAGASAAGSITSGILAGLGGSAASTAGNIGAYKLNKATNYVGKAGNQVKKATKSVEKAEKKNRRYMNYTV